MLSTLWRHVKTVIRTLHLLTTISIGLLIGTLARSMPQFGVLLMLILLPLQVLYSGTPPWESVPEFVVN